MGCGPSSENATSARYTPTTSPEARSHERLSLLALNSEDKSFKSLYESLLESEARHFGVYWKLAQTKFSKNQTFKRLEELSEIESSILAETFVLPRVHS